MKMTIWPATSAFGAGNRSPNPGWSLSSTGAPVVFSPLLAQPVGSPHHQGALAHLARVQHVAELPTAQRLVQLVVRPALDVGGRVPRQGAAGNVEGTAGELRSPALPVSRSGGVRVHHER